MTWSTVCPLSSIPLDRGVGALVRGEQVALFRTAVGSLPALSNLDPAGGAMVLSRGIVGSRGDRAVVTSPMYKTAYDLATGVGVDDPELRVDVHEVSVHAGFVGVRLVRDQSLR